jgi:hypothetical protein
MYISVTNSVTVNNIWLRDCKGRTDIVTQLFNITVASNKSNSRSDGSSSAEKCREAAQGASHIFMLFYSNEWIYSILIYLFFCFTKLL